MRKHKQKARKNALKIRRVFPPGQPTSRAESFWLAASWSASPGALERWQLRLQRATLGSPVASPVWPESSPEKHEKTAPARRLPGAITVLSELRFVQTLYLWKVDIENFPTICWWPILNTRKPPKSPSKIGSKNSTLTKIEEDSEGGLRGG
jgi:hypothetical protein